jgi:thimet oligopeptidase
MIRFDTLGRSYARATHTLGRTALAALAVATLIAAIPGASLAEYADMPPVPKDAASMTALVKDQLAMADQKLQQILSVKGARTVENTLVPYNQMSIALDLASGMSGLMENVHPEETLRTAAEASRQELAQFVTKLSLNQDLYKAIAALDVSKEDASTTYLVQKTLRDFRRAGVDKDEPTRKKVEALQQELVKIGQEFDRNIREDKRSINLDNVKSLEGLPQDYIDAHKPDESGKITITTDYPDFFPFMTYSKDADARKRLYMEFQKRGNPKNLETLDRLIGKRTELAQTLGYKTWADFITENKMIETKENAASFIDRITEAATPRAQREYNELLQAKKKDDESATEVADYDKMYYSEIVKNEKYSFDSQSVRPYFDYPIVRDGIMNLTSKLFGVTFSKVEGLPVWHPDVDSYDVMEGDRYLGRIFLDMHPREGKYGHAAQFTIRSGVKDVQSPIGVLVCNFPGGANAAPGEALMEHDDVETFLHEFGHLLHHTFGGHQRWIDQSGVATEHDFVEAPSQFLEEWAWDAATLQTFAKHYETGESIPGDIVAKMRSARDFGKGLSVRQQMFYAKVSLSMYDRDPASIKSTSELVRDIQNKYSMYKHVDGTTMQTGFGHLEGYSAVYYTYMWSLVIAKDLFSKFDKANLLDPVMATTYRKSVLDPGGTKKAKELVRDFLGRDFDFTSYETWLNAD